MIYKLPYQSELAIKSIQTAKEGFICEIRKAKKQRSLNQNSYYWGVVIKIFAFELGYTDQEMHQILGHNFLRYTNKNHEFIRSTTELSTGEFEDYLTKCRMLAGEQGIYIPLPNECTEEILMQIERMKI